MLPIGTTGVLKENAQTTFMCIQGNRCRIQEVRPQQSEYIVQLNLPDGSLSEDFYCVSTTSFHSDQEVSAQPSKKALKAANDLEDLLPHFKEVINEIRAGHERVYSLLYEARAHMNRIITHEGLGAGVPPKSGHDWGEV